MAFWDRWFGPPSRGAFARQLIRQLRRAGDRRPTNFDAEKFTLELFEDGRKIGSMNLRNLYEEFIRAPRSERPAWWSRTLRGLLTKAAVPEDFEDARPDLRPIVRTRSYVESLRLQAEIEGAPPSPIPYVPVGDHLMACLAYDLPSSLVYIHQRQLNDWGITLYEGMEVAQQNLAETPCKILALDKHIFIPSAGDAYDATRILLHDMLERLPFAGDPVAMAVNVNKLIFAGADDDRGLTMMVDLAEKFADEPRPLCSVPLRFSDGEWRTWMPAADHPDFRRFRMLQLGYLASEYESQKQLLDALHEARQVDQFVASFTAVQKNDRLFSYAVWSKGVPTHLPETDEVFFFDPDQNTMRRAPWQRVVDTMHAAMEARDDRYPPRWFVDGFPTPEQFTAMDAQPMESA